ncbi:30S ribosomal protein S16, partial [Trifolium medium]|nr:30S ribosomal protein S16 [Trifolium medium]
RLNPNSKMAFETGSRTVGSLAIRNRNTGMNIEYRNYLELFARMTMRKHMFGLSMFDKDDEKRMNIKLERVKYWLSVGAQPSESVESLLFRSGLQVKRKGGLSGVDTPNQEQSANDKEADGVSPEAVFSIGLQV